MKMRHLLSATLACAATAPAHAVTFNFGNLAATVPLSFSTCSSTDRCSTTLGGSLTFAQGGISVSASGTYQGNAAAPVQDAPSGGPAGLGVYHLITYPGPVVGNTSDDNVSFEETLTLTFNQVVSLSNILFRNGDHGTTFAGDFGLSVDGNPMTNQLLVSSFNTPLQGQTFAFTGLGNPENTKFYINTLTVTPVPEPETYALMLAGLGALGAFARRRRQQGT